jgi:hypothetical protein
MGSRRKKHAALPHEIGTEAVDIVGENFDIVIKVHFGPLPERAAANPEVVAASPGALSCGEAPLASPCFRRSPHSPYPKSPRNHTPQKVMVVIALRGETMLAETFMLLLEALLRNSQGNNDEGVRVKSEAPHVPIELPAAGLSIHSAFRGKFRGLPTSSS